MLWAQKLCINANVPQSTNSLRTIGVVSKVVRQETRIFFYASTDLLLYGDGITRLGYFGLQKKLFQKLGHDGTANLRSLQFELRLRPMDYGSQEHLAFSGFFCSVAFCSSLRHFNMDLSAHHIFGSDLDELKALFLFDQERPFPGLENIATVFTSLPKLSEVNIVMRPHVQIDQETPGQDCMFLRYAFSGMRQVASWVVIAQRLQADNLCEVPPDASKDKLDQVSVNIEYGSLPNLSKGTRSKTSALGFCGMRGRGQEKFEKLASRR